MSFALEFIQATFVTVPIVDFPTSSLDAHEIGTQAKPSNVTNHMPTSAVVSRKQMGWALCSAWLERQSHPCVTSSQFMSMCPRVCTIQIPPFRMQPLTQIDHNHAAVP